MHQIPRPAHCVISQRVRLRKVSLCESGVARHQCVVGLKNWVCSKNCHNTIVADQGLCFPPHDLIQLVAVQIYIQVNIR